MDGSEAAVEVVFRVEELVGTGLMEVFLVQRAAENAVPRGETRSRRLRHVQVVRATAETGVVGPGVVRLRLPGVDGLAAEGTGVVAVLRDPGSGAVVAATSSEATTGGTRP